MAAAGAGTEAEPEDEPPEDEALVGAPMHMCPFLGSPHTLHLYTTMDADAGQEKKNGLPLLAPRKNFIICGGRDQEQTPLTPPQMMNVRELFSMFKDAMEREHKRKCDAFDAAVNNFMKSHFRNTKEAANVIKRLKPMIGDEVVAEVMRDVIAMNRARKAQASSSASSSTHSNSGPSASSSSASSNVTEDGEVVCTGERTVEERNREGFANAIVLDENELLTVRVLKPKGM